MKTTHQNLITAQLGLCLLFSAAFIQAPAQPDNPVYQDDFENYTSDRDLQKSYQVWEDGAHITVALYSGSVNPAGQAIQVQVLTPNPQNNAMYGSIYHYLPARNRNWSGSTGIRFWVKNVSDDRLLLSVNFKEKFNEYWAVAQEGVFFLHHTTGQIEKKEIAYGNLPIPAQFSGYVTVPFFSFSVPGWNTARGDEIMDLSGIETLAFGITIEEDFPHIFLLDEIALITQADYSFLEIKGPDQVQVPSSGEHHEPFTAYLKNPTSGSSELVNAQWEMVGDARQPILLDDGGWLSVPADLPDSQVEIQAQYETPQEVLFARKIVTISASTGTVEQETTAAESAVTPGQPSESSDYERFSQSFETWAAQNRPIFVAAAVIFVLLILWVLSSFQKKIK